MISVWGPLMLTSMTGAILALPFTPALVELVCRRDAGPLETRKDDGDIRNFATAFRSYIAKAKPTLAKCASKQSLEEVQLRDGQWALVIGVFGHCDEIQADFPNLALFSRAVWLRDRQVFKKDVYAADVLHTGKRNVFRAILGEKDIFLEAESQVMRWIHAEESVVTAEGTRLFGRASAGESISLGEGCHFERVHAPSIFAGPGTQAQPAMQTVVRNSADEQSKKKAGKVCRSRIHGDLRLRLGEMFLGDIVATGSIYVEKETQIVGSAKAHGDIRLDDRAQIEGAVVSAASIRTGSNCYVAGPLVAEHEIHLGAGTRIGNLTSPTTVSAPRIYIARGSIIHGTVCARVEGRVEV